AIAPMVKAPRRLKYGIIGRRRYRNGQSSLATARSAGSLTAANPIGSHWRKLLSVGRWANPSGESVAGARVRFTQYITGTPASDEVNDFRSFSSACFCP